MGAPLAYFEITSRDPRRLTRFYGQLFDWTITEGPMPGYSMVDTGAGEGAIGGGIGTVQGTDGSGGVKIYMRVDDLQRYLDAAETLGGRTIIPPTALPGDYGAFAVFADPDGNAVGLWA